MAPARVAGIDALQALLGREIGPTAPLTITQDMVNRFADLTQDDNWMHVDPERAAQKSPYGGTIAHGDLLVALLATLRAQLVDPVGFDLRINRGWRGIVFERPVRVGTEIVAVSRPIEVKALQGGVFEFVEELEIRTEEAGRACLAQSVTWLAQG
jgi:acyl dehydratase